jgi:hypothetical protein
VVSGGGRLKLKHFLGFSGSRDVTEEEDNEKEAGVGRNQRFDRRLQGPKPGMASGVAEKEWWL